METRSQSRDIFEILLKRATCRNFLPDPIPDDLMEKLLSAACASPSSGGFQNVSIICVKDEEKKKRLSQLSRSQAFVARAPVNLVFCVDHRRMRRIAEYELSPCAEGNSVGSLIIGVVDATIATQSVVLAAEALGLRSCYNGNVIDHPKELRELLKLPPGVLPVIMLTVGYPAASVVRRSRKYPPKVMVHEEVYRDLPMAELYAAHEEKYPETYSANKERREMLFRAAERQLGTDFAQRCVEKVDAAGKLTAYQFWFGCYYARKSPTEASAAEYLDYLAEQGFDVAGEKKR